MVMLKCNKPKATIPIMASKIRGAANGLDQQGVVEMVNVMEHDILGQIYG